MNFIAPRHHYSGNVLRTQRYEGSYVCNLGGRSFRTDFGVGISVHCIAVAEPNTLPIESRTNRAGC